MEMIIYITLSINYFNGTATNTAVTLTLAIQLNMANVNLANVRHHIRGHYLTPGRRLRC